MSDFWNELKKIPPVTRFIVLSTVAVTVPGMILKLVNPYLLLFNYKLVTESFELWRIYTSFFIASPGITFVFDIAILYQNSNTLEEGNYPRRSADYAWHLLLSAASILALNIPLNSAVHFRALFICILTVLSLINPDASTSLFGLITFPRKYYPFVMLGMDAIQGGVPAAMQAVSGIITGYAWWLLEWRELPGAGAARPGSGRTLGRAPDWLKRIVGEGGPVEAAPPAPVAGAQGGVHVIAPAGRALNDGGRPIQPAATGGYNWGSGNRLGTD